jgi:hypothetical protein
MFFDDSARHLTGGEIIALVAIGGGILLGLVLGLAGIIMTNWRQWRQFQSEVTLKNEMVRKEMRVEDIERVIRVTHPGNTEPSGSPSKPAAQPAAEMTPRQLDARVATLLAGMDMDAEKIEQGLGAVVVADLDTKRAVVGALEEMIENGVDEDKVLACLLAFGKSSRTAITAL